LFPLELYFCVWKSSHRTGLSTFWALSQYLQDKYNAYSCRWCVLCVFVAKLEKVLWISSLSQFLSTIHISYIFLDTALRNMHYIYPEDIVIMLKMLIVQFCERIFKHRNIIPMGTNCGTLASLLFCFELICDRMDLRQRPSWF
jgi:hypothetical protein